MRETLYQVRLSYKLEFMDDREMQHITKNFKQLRSAVKYAYKKAYIEPFTKGYLCNVGLEVLGEGAIWFHPDHKEVFECLQYNEFQIKDPTSIDETIPDWYIEDIKESI